MQRLVAFCAALLVSSVAVSSACTASATQPVRFTLEPARSEGRVHASFRKADRNNNNWSTDLPASELAGLDLARLRSSATGPVRFALIREAGRLDCAGTGGKSMAIGSCTFTPDSSFTRFSLAAESAAPTPMKRSR